MKTEYLDQSIRFKAFSGDSTKCCIKGCDDPIAYTVCFRVWAKNRQGMPAEGISAISVCALHSLQLTIRDVFDEDEWQQLCDAFTRCGKARPDRNLSEVYMRKLDDPLVIQVRGQFAEKNRLKDLELHGDEGNQETCFVSCDKCGLKEAPFKVRLRRDGEIITDYMNAVIVPCSGEAHYDASPDCKVEKLEMVKIPGRAFGWTEEEMKQAEGWK